MHLFVSFLFVLGRAPSLSSLTPSTELIFFFLNEYVETYRVEIRQPHPMFRHRGRKPFTELFSPLGLLFLKRGIVNPFAFDLFCLG